MDYKVYHLTPEQWIGDQSQNAYYNCFGTFRPKEKERIDFALLIAVNGQGDGGYAVPNRQVGAVVRAIAGVDGGCRGEPYRLAGRCRKTPDIVGGQAVAGKCWHRLSWHPEDRAIRHSRRPRAAMAEVTESARPAEQ